MKGGIIARSLNSIRYYLTPSQKRKALWMMVLLLITSFLDVLGLASLVPVMMVAAEPGGVQKSKLFSPVYNFFEFESERTFLLYLIIIIFVFFLVKNAFSTWVNYMQNRFVANIALTVIKSQINKYINFPFWYLNDLGSPNLMHSTVNIPGNFVGGIMRPLFIFFSEVAIVLVTVISIILYKPLLFGILALVLVPTTLLTYRALRNRSQMIGSEIHRLRPISQGIIGDLFTGFVEIKLANKQHRFRDSLLNNQEKVQRLDALSYLYSMLPLKMIEMVAILGILTIFLYAIFSPGSSSSLISLVGLFAAAAYRLMPSVNRMITSMMQLKTTQYAIENLSLYRDKKYNETPPVEQLPVSFKKTLHFEDVTFNFPGVSKSAVKAIDITIKKGEKIGFIGSSGSGKTTLMNILLRFYVEQSGHILVDGQPLTSQHLLAWYRIIGYVKQDTFLMQRSIRDNITLGDSDVNEERLNYALKQASLQSFVSGLPEGINTLVGERGSKLSGGQRQRIGIARALYKQTEILVLDEATSALDNETEREVNEAIDKLAETEITILIIAHRITTLRNCDKIYELRDGQIIAEHRYEELVKAIV
ncbi:ABC transporter ATP-binding protein [Hymenobacter sp. BT683]|uniref:ABC transporter ATP-binding protein n=1 Tax=Hymenobacter jeongseonensis TaxID=2791027 RepID=A0ABS0IEL5_9BACT|nr:ABC transporter ATP-binding protein [Hymenobacter jeongseonensis]MBF9236755.1 ABC transporter ATP-binding protein [Hymenobacter jeongseonensis]